MVLVGEIECLSGLESWKRTFFYTFSNPLYGVIAPNEVTTKKHPCLVQSGKYSKSTLHDACY